MTSIKAADKERERAREKGRKRERERKTAQQRRLNKIPIELMTIEIGFQL